ncbi:indole-3-glycerol-phosphate synthase [Methanocalculus taiwanensis]|uniref:indole-3-glycerol-phosphate synthase n=1 Tax=Methanocalculus taiwanensis TaxID=106207 RepID=A0ABD4TID1_9EURY|nr:indole-3-glycerol-phosphate synthase [Methanocalculus taiwanensis]MCQ1537513.1 indole-3-glycerol-phosphate synthase [Methanocalculus taiwanensis]
MVLDALIASSHRRAAALPDTFPSALFPLRSLKKALLSRSPAIIGEVKYASPGGPTGATLPPGRLAAAMAAGGAVAISVLTEPTVFAGDPSFIREVRRHVTLPILRKDILVHTHQIRESRALGADAVLLIASVLGDDLPVFVDFAIACGLEPLVEVVSSEEAVRALATRADLIGINNRDLRTLEIDLACSARIAPVIRAAGRIPVAMSGISNPVEVQQAMKSCCGVLIGTSIASAADPREATEAFACT